jgi:hypothetical protein
MWGNLIQILVTSKYSPPGSGLNLCSCYSKHKCTRPSNKPPSWNRISEGGYRQQGKISPIEVTTNSLFYCSRVTWSSTKAHTFTSFPLPWYFRMNRVDNILLPSFNHSFPKIQSQATITWNHDRIGFAWIAPRHKHILLCWPGDIHSVTQSPQSSIYWHPPATTFAYRKAQSRNMQSENRRWLTDANIYKKLYEF